jgi:hypothetical protein
MSKKPISLRKLPPPLHAVLHGPIQIHDSNGRYISGYATYDQNDSSLTFSDNGSQQTRTFDLLMIPNITMNTLDEWEGRLDTNCSINSDVSCTINSFALLGLIGREQAINLSIYRNSLGRAGAASDIDIIHATQLVNDIQSLIRYKQYIMADFNPASLITITQRMGKNDAILLNLIYHNNPLGIGHTVVLLKTEFNGSEEIILADPQLSLKIVGMVNIMNHLQNTQLLVDKISLLYVDRIVKTLLPHEVDKRMRVSPTFEEKLALTSEPTFSMGKRSSPKKTKKKLPKKKLPKKKGGKTKKRNVKKA